MQADVIFPCIHIARNERGRDREPANVVTVGVKQGAQTALRIQAEHFVAQIQINQDRMAATPFELWNDQFGAGLPCVDYCFDNFDWDCRMIYQSDKYGFGAWLNFSQATSNRSTHFAFDVRIQCECDLRVLQVMTDFIGAMAYHDNNVCNTRALETIDARVDDGRVTERQ
jgi:hypothetical protein